MAKKIQFEAEDVIPVEQEISDPKYFDSIFYSQSVSKFLVLKCVVLCPRT